MDNLALCSLNDFKGKLCLPVENKEMWEIATAHGTASHIEHSVPLVRPEPLKWNSGNMKSLRDHLWNKVQTNRTRRLVGCDTAMFNSLYTFVK